MLLRGLRVDHVAVVIADLVMQALRGVAQQVAVPVDGAALDRQILTPERGERGLKARRAVDDDELRPPETACVEVGQEPAPCRGALSAHLSYGKQHLMAVPAHADGGQHGYFRRLSVDPGLYHRAVQDQADDVPMARLRAHQASQSDLTRRQARLTTSLLTAPLNSAKSARFTRRVFVPER